jgi:hypothetical protein
MYERRLDGAHDAEPSAPPTAEQQALMVSALLLGLVALVLVGVCAYLLLKRSGT